MVQGLMRDSEGNILNAPPLASGRCAGFVRAVALALAMTAGPMTPGAFAQSSDPGAARADPIADLLASPAAMVPPRVEAVQDPFQISNVAVDVTADSAVSAKERGLIQGRLAAFDRLIERIVLRESVTMMPRPSAGEIIDMVQEFSVANERSSAVRYLADLNVKFNPIAVRSYLGSAQIPFTELYSRPMVIVTILQPDPISPALLWSDPDPWANAIARYLPRDGLVPMVSPFADITDFGLLNIEQVLSSDVAALLRFAERYQAGGVIIALATRTIEAPDAFQVTIREVRTAGSTFETTVPPAGATAASIDAALDAAAAAAVVQIEENWKRRNMIQAGVAGEIVAMADIASLQDWVGLETRLKQVPLVGRVNLQAMTRARVQVAISHAGTVDQLRSALALQSLDLSDVDGLWTVAPARAAVIGLPPGVAVPSAIELPAVPAQAPETAVP